jgi:hypothetical protein
VLPHVDNLITTIEDSLDSLQLLIVLLVIRIFDESREDLVQSDS